MRAARSRSPNVPPTSAACARSRARSPSPTTSRASASASRSSMAEKATLLVELLTEELPPKSLRALSEAFAGHVTVSFVKAHLATASPALTVYATPRRLAFTIEQTRASAAGRETEVTGPSATAPAQAIAGFARKHGLTPEQLERRDTPKGPVMLARVSSKGAVLDEVLAAMVEAALKALPIPKLMRWGAGEAQFVRPVHGLVMLHGERVVPGSVLGIKAGRTTAGHLLARFLIVSNMPVADPRHIVGGNERVVRPRLEDARFFYNQDRKTRLEARVPLLAKVVYHAKLGSQLERVQRIQLLAGAIARSLKADTALAEPAAWLCQADLLTGMVGAFPQLPGGVGRYHARHDC